MITSYLKFLIPALLILTVLLPQEIVAQRLDGNYGIQGRLQLTLGNQNTKLDAGLSAFGTLNYGDAAIEGGINLVSGQLFKRHTVRASGLFYAYEFFALAGIGQNSNLLGSAVADLNKGLLFDSTADGGFSGLGFGFQKEFLPKELDHFTNKRGKLLMRFSNADHAIDIAFMNDFRFGKLFNGAGTDFGETGALVIGFTQIQSPSQAYRAGIGIELFTPKPNYSRTPNNPINSDDGRKNVWHTVSPYPDLFYANAFAFGSYQDVNFSAFAKAGLNSQKLGAYVQNMLHDSFGLNPRFPWNITARDKIIIEGAVSGQLNITSDD